MATFPPSSLALPQPRASLGSRARACLAARPRAHPADPRPPAPPRKLSGRRRRARGSLARPRGLLSSLLHTRPTRPHPLRSDARPARAVWRRQRRARAAPPARATDVAFLLLSFLGLFSNCFGGGSAREPAVPHPHPQTGLRVRAPANPPTLRRARPGRLPAHQGPRTRTPNGHLRHPIDRSTPRHDQTGRGVTV